MKALRRWLVWSAILGLVAPVVWFSLFFALREIPRPAYEILTRLWPTSIFLLATAGGEGTFAAYKVIGTAILGNVGLYCLVGLVVWALASRFMLWATKRSATWGMFAGGLFVIAVFAGAAIFGRLWTAAAYGL